MFLSFLGFNVGRIMTSGAQHLVIDIVRIMEGLILYRDTYQGGPIKFFSNASQWTFVSKNSVYVIQVLIGDGVIVSFVIVRINIIDSSIKCTDRFIAVMRYGNQDLSWSCLFVFGLLSLVRRIVCFGCDQGP